LACARQDQLQTGPLMTMSHSHFHQLSFLPTRSPYSLRLSPGTKTLSRQAFVFRLLIPCCFSYVRFFKLLTQHSSYRSLKVAVLGPVFGQPLYIHTYIQHSSRAECLDLRPTQPIGHQGKYDFRVGTFYRLLFFCFLLNENNLKKYSLLGYDTV
jgi:hypothetical protein